MKRRKVWIIVRFFLPLVPAALVAFIAWVFTQSAFPVWHGGMERVLIPALVTYVLVFAAVWFARDPQI